MPARPAAHGPGGANGHDANGHDGTGFDLGDGRHDRGGAVPPAPPAGQEPSGPTASGLARRVRGAQLPTTQPLNLRRNQEHPSGGTAGYRLGDNDDASGHMLGNVHTGGYTVGHANGATNGYSANGHANGRADGDHEESSAARSVYGFLTSFTQGVQRGLEEVRRDPNTPKENS
jgi:hypothetical protein